MLLKKKKEHCGFEEYPTKWSWCVVALSRQDVLLELRKQQQKVCLPSVFTFIPKK